MYIWGDYLPDYTRPDRVSFHDYMYFFKVEDVPPSCFLEDSARKIDLKKVLCVMYLWNDLYKYGILRFS